MQAVVVRNHKENHVPEDDKKKPESKPAQKPSVGRMVHYYPAEKQGEPRGKAFWPATITHVNNDGSVNLSVCQDGAFRLTDLLPTGVGFFGPDAAIPPDTDGWQWPPLVK